MPSRMCYRGSYGDTEPKPIHPSQALALDGSLRRDHFATECEAWASVLAHMEDGVEQAEQRYNKAETELRRATELLVVHRAAKRKSESAFRAWKTRHPMSVAV